MVEAQQPLSGLLHSVEKPWRGTPGGSPGSAVTRPGGNDAQMAAMSSEWSVVMSS
jgi:hypothetical protein